MIKQSWGDAFNIDLMISYQNPLVYRGTLIWPQGSMIAGPGFLFFDRRLKVFGPSIIFSIIPKEESSFSWDIGARYFNDNEPYIRIRNYTNSHRNQRDGSLESYTRFNYKFGPRGKFFFDLYLGRELIEHRGLYGEFRFGFPILPFTSITGGISHAEKSTNQYLYGPEGVSGDGYALAGIKFVIPFVPWDGIIINQLHHTWVTQRENRLADYVRGDSNHWSFTTRWIWKAY